MRDASRAADAHFLSLQQTRFLLCRSGSVPARLGQRIFRLIVGGKMRDASRAADDHALDLSVQQEFIDVRR